MTRYYQSIVNVDDFSNNRITSVDILDLMNSPSFRSQLDQEARKLGITISPGLEVVQVNGN